MNDLQLRGSARWRNAFSMKVEPLPTPGSRRDPHPRNFCMWMAGGGIKPGISYGETDEFSYNIVENPVHLNDLNATIFIVSASTTRASPSKRKASTSASPASNL